MGSTYCELQAPSGLESVVACLWESERSENHSQKVIPDGCVDLIWLADGELVVAGADTGPRTVALPGRKRSSGIRLRPGAAGAAMGLPACELVDRQVPAELLWGDYAVRLARALAASGPAARLDLLTEAVRGRRVRPDPLVQAAARALARPGARVSGAALDLGVSERQLRRRMLDAVGYGPKLFARVARLRRLISLGEESLAARAFEAGFASQAHMNDEVRLLTGTTPVRFLEDAILTAA